MSGSLRHAWNYLPAELWEPLSGYSTVDAVAPLDLFGDLFSTAEEHLAPRPTLTELGIARNNPEEARHRFLGLTGTDFATESAIVQFLEEAFDVIGEYELPGFTDLYRRLLGDVLTKFNLRYRLESPCTLRFLLPGSFANLYSELQRMNSTNPHLFSLLNDFEKAFDRYARTEDATDLKTCIHKASNYVEGLASATRGNAGTLGALCDQLTDWPHERVREALKSLYKFCSDYPGIRHGGDPNGVLRDLGVRDVATTSLLLLSFSGYLSPTIDERIVLGV